MSMVRQNRQTFENRILGFDNKSWIFDNTFPDFDNKKSIFDNTFPDFDNKKSIFDNKLDGGLSYLMIL
jgi:hypothetical protein